MKKNISGQDWVVFAFNRTDNTAKTGDAGNITAKISKDGVAGDATNDVNPTELESGYYVFDLTQAETNANVVSIIPVSATANIQVIGVPGTVYTNASIDQTGDSYTIVNGDHGLVSIQDDVDTLSSRLSDTRATYLDYLFSIYFGLVSGVAQAQAGAAATITMAAGASAVNDFYKGQTVAVYTGTGAGQARAISAYVGATKVATVTPAWATAPDATSWYVIMNVGSAVVEDWIDGGRLDLILDDILLDTGTTIPGTITTIDNEIAVIDTVVDAIKVKTDNLPGAIPKAVALADFAFVMYSSTDHVTPMTGLTVSGTISKDGGAFAALDGTIAAISSGVYQVDSITATEMDADLIVLRFTATGADDVVIVIKTDT